MEWPNMMLNFCQKFIIAIDLNACAFSVTIFQGQLNLDKIFSFRKLNTTVLVAFLMGLTSTHLVK
jgi:hypothetical protein